MIWGTDVIHTVMQDILVFSDKDIKMVKSCTENLQQACCPAVIKSIGSFRIDDSYGEKARLGDVYFLRPIYTIRFVAYNSYSGVWKRALMSDFHSFADGESWNLTFFTRVYSITYTRVRIVCDKSYRVDRPLNSPPHPVFVLGLDHLPFSRHIVSQKQDIIKFAVQLILNGKIL